MESRPFIDLAIEAVLMPRLAFHLPLLRQTEWLMGSLFEVLGMALSVLDRSTLSPQAMSLVAISKGYRLPGGPVHRLIDSIGLKGYGAREYAVPASCSGAAVAGSRPR